jgi:uncharacterized membrane protein YeaQ/YmgE (transglycosylase-associated protein family)
VCGTCAFFGKPSLCPRRERFEGAEVCRLYERREKVDESSPLFPLRPDTRELRESREIIEEVIEGPSFLWYFVPFFFGILGGIVGYVAVRDKDENMALGLLLFGIFWTVIGSVLYLTAVSLWHL